MKIPTRTPAKGPASIGEPTAFYFAGPLRQPEIIIVAHTELEAKTEFKKLAGRVVTPKKSHPVLIASADIQDMMQVMLEGDTPRTEYESMEADDFPILSYFGPHSIRPAWTIDRRTGKVVPSGEYQSIPERMLDLSNKPTPEMVQTKGGIIVGSFDEDVKIINDTMPWLRLEDGEDLRNRLIDECTRWERRFGS